MKIKLQEILDNRNISVYSLSKEIGVTQNNLGKLVKGETTSIKYDILEKLCNILDITPNDIFEIEPQLTLFNYNKDKKTLLSEDTLQIIDKINNNNKKSLTLIADDDFDLEQMQIRFEMENKLSNNLFLITDNIIYNADISNFSNQLTSDIERYKNMTNSIEASKFMFVYRILYIIVVQQLKNKQLLGFIMKIKNIYSVNPFFNTIEDEELQSLINESNELLNNLNIKQKD